MSDDGAKEQAKEMLVRYAALFWQAGIGKFDEMTFADHEGIARSVRETLEICKWDLERAKSGNASGLQCAVRDMATLEGVLK